MQFRWKTCTAFILWIAVAGFAPAFAASQPPGVARVSVIQHGSLIITRGDEKKTQTVAVVNAPVFAGDFLSTTDADARVEIQLDGYTVLRLGGPVQVRLVSNDAGSHQVDVAEGLVEVSVLHKDGQPIDVVTPPVSVRLDRTGDYRISVASDGTTSITPRRGQAEIETPHKSFTADTRQTLIAKGQASDPSIQFADEIARDTFDDFNTDRDRALFAALNGDTYVPPNIAGYDNLNQYGRWANVAPYGESWIPNQGSDWVPYRDGTWVWGGAYGWTWVADEPWGWLPYHYGSWFYADGYGWCWYPPSISVVPVWVPAFVTFFDYGWSPFGYSNFGWYPVGPYENFYPWYPWYWGWYNPWPRPVSVVPLPTPPPPRHHHDPIHFHPGASTIDARRWRDGQPVRPTALDPKFAGSIKVQRGALPMEPTEATRKYSPIVVMRPVRLSTVFDSPRFAGTQTLAQIPKPPAVRDTALSKSWDHFYQARGSMVTPAEIRELAPMTRETIESAMREPYPVLHTNPVEHTPSSPIEHTPIDRTPSSGGHVSGPPATHGGDTHGGDTHGSTRPPV